MPKKQKKPKRITTRLNKMSRWVAVMLYWVDGSRQWKVWVASEEAHTNREDARREGKEWALTDGLEYVE